MSIWKRGVALDQKIPLSFVPKSSTFCQVEGETMGVRDAAVVEVGIMKRTLPPAFVLRGSSLRLRLCLARQPSTAR